MPDIMARVQQQGRVLTMHGGCRRYTQPLENFYTQAGTPSIDGWLSTEAAQHMKYDAAANVEAHSSVEQAPYSVTLQAGEALLGILLALLTQTYRILLCCMLSTQP